MSEKEFVGHAEEAQERLAQAVKLIASIMLDRHRDVHAISILMEDIPESARIERTKLFNLMSYLLVEASKTLVLMSKGFDARPEWERLQKTCDTILEDMDDKESKAIHEEVRLDLERVSFLNFQGAPVSPLCRELVARHWPKIASGNPKAWRTASDESIKFFLEFFPVNGPADFNRLSPTVQHEVRGLVGTLAEYDQWRFRNHLESIRIGISKTRGT